MALFYHQEIYYIWKEITKFYCSSYSVIVRVSVVLKRTVVGD